MKFHEAANIFPMMGDDDLERLADDIQAHGQTDAIETLDGKILDGRNRFRACQLRGIKPEFMQAQCNGSTPTEYVVSKNLHRRHLSESQRSVIGARIQEYFTAAAQERMKRGKKADPSTNLDEGRSDDKAAAMVNVSRGSIHSAAKVLESGSPELIAAVERDEIAVSRAAKIAELPKAQQRAVVKDGGELPPPRKPKQKPPERDAEIESIVADVEAIEERLSALSKSSAGEVKKKLRFAVKLLRESIDLIREK